MLDGSSHIRVGPRGAVAGFCAFPATAFFVTEHRKMTISSSEKAAITNACSQSVPNVLSVLDAVAGFSQVAAVADLDQDISATYAEAEVQAISDKVDELLAALRTAGLLGS